MIASRGNAPGGSESRELARDLRLDVLRAVAVAFVFATHLPTCPPEQSRLLNTLTIPMVRGGWVGVDLFFALSGYLIAGLLFREYRRTGTIAFGRFLVRRGFKIYPPLWALCAITLVAWPAGSGQVANGSAVAATLLFYGNYQEPIWYHLWSLSVEEHFYFLLPALLSLYMPRGTGRPARPWRLLPIVVAGLAALTLVARIAVALANTDPRDVGRIQNPTHLRADALAMGVLLAYLEVFMPGALDAMSLRLRRLCAVLGTVILLTAFAWDVRAVTYHAAIAYSLYPFAGVLLIVGSRGFTAENGITRVMAYLGSRSYSLYLWHLPMFALVSALTRGRGYSWALVVLVSTASALAAGLAMAKLVELPALAIRDRFFPGRSGVRTAEASRA